MRGLADDLQLYPWLSTQVWPFSELMTEEDFYYAGLIGCLENLKTSTSCIDRRLHLHLLNNGDHIFEAMRDSGIRGNMCRCFANIFYYRSSAKRTRTASSMTSSACTASGPARRTAVCP